MAGLSNAKFLAPSYFTKSEDTTEQSSKNTMLIPPSTYNKANVTRKTAAEKSREVISLEKENSDLKETIGKLLEEKRYMSKAKDQCVGKRSRKEESLKSELHLAKRMVGDLEQEKEILEYEVEDKEALSAVVLKLKKELRRAKEKMSTKEKAMTGKELEYSETVRRLRSELKVAESTYLEQTSRLKQNCVKHIENVERLNKENNEVGKRLEEKEREFENMFWEKKQEKDELIEKFKKQLVEQEISENKLKKLEEANELFEEDGRQLKDGNKILDKELLKEKETCVQLRNEVSLKSSSIAELQERVKTLEEDLNREEMDHRNRVMTMEKENELNIKKLEVIIQSNEERILHQQQIHLEKLQEKEDEIKELVRSVEQLRSYIGEIRPSQEAQKLGDLNKQLTNTVQVMTEENDTLLSTVKLLNVRLSSILEIVAIQETELTRNDDEVHVGTSRESQGLLRKWREKVFALMVQLQCQRIVKSDQKRVDTVQLNAVNAKLEDLEREHCVLSHKLADKEAALELEVNLRRTKSQEVKKLKEEYNVFKKQENMWLTQFQILSRTTQAVEKTLLHSLLIFKKAVGKMSLFDQRLKFAGCRIHFMSEFLTNRDSQGKAQASDCKQISSKKIEDSPDGDLNDNDEHHLKDEVEKLLKERAALLNETKKHNETLREKTSQITQEYTTIIEQKNERIEKLEASETEMKEKVFMLQENQETKTLELEEALESVEELKLTLSKQKTAVEKAHREAFEKERLRNMEDMRSIEGQLNDIRREHAKDIAALRNAEREVSRVKEHSSKMVANIEREFNEKLARCQKQLKNVEKERNLLMVKIREDKKNVSRLRPLTGHDMAPEKEHVVREKTERSSKSKPQSCKQSDVISGTRKQGGTRDAEGQENVERIDPNEAFAALRELKILSEQIVKMHGDNESSISDSEY